MSSIVDYTDRTTCILFGDGAGCVLLERSENGEGFEDAVLHGDGAGAQYLYMRAGGSLHPASHETVDKRLHFLRQEGRPVFKAAVKGMKDVTLELLGKQNVKADDLDWIVPHQANMRIINSLSDFLEVPKEKVMINIDRYGNTTAATIPLCLWDYEKQLKKGDQMILTAFGGGYTWGTIYMTWAYDSN